MSSTDSNSDNESLRVEAQPVGLFETPIAYGRLKDGESLMVDLEQTIRARMAEDDGLSRSNIGAWHSDTDMLSWGGEAAKELAQAAVNIAKRMSHFKESLVEERDWLVRMWANVTPEGGLNHLHSHPGNLWAAVLYIDMGNEPGESEQEVGGHLYLEDPRFPMAAMRDTSFRMMGVNGQPQPYESAIQLQRGNLVVFPAWLRHGVRPFKGKRERISIAMNIDARLKD